MSDIVFLMLVATNITGGIGGKKVGWSCEYGSSEYIRGRASSFPQPSLSIQVKYLCQNVVHKRLHCRCPSYRSGGCPRSRDELPDRWNDLPWVRHRCRPFYLLSAKQLSVTKDSLPLVAPRRSRDNGRTTTRPLASRMRRSCATAVNLPTSLPP